jgi:hypothetical protein
MSRKIVGSMSDWSGVLKDVFRQIDDGSLTLAHMKAVAEHRNPFIPLDSLLEDWRRFYKKHFGLEVNLSNLKTPEQQPGFDRLIIVAQGLTLNQVYDVCSKHFSCWRCVKNLDKAIVENDRTSDKGSYAVWFRDRQEADEELEDLSADQLAGKKISGITLLERLIYELKYWDETGKHLDIFNVTLCAGSRDSGGNVPGVDWDDVGLGVRWSDSGTRRDYLRSRAAVPQRIL